MKKIRNVVIILIINIALIYLSNTSLAVTGKVNSETVRMRKGPSTDTGIVMLISIDEEVEILGEEGEFYKVKYEKTTGYISKSLINTENKVNIQTVQDNIQSTEKTEEKNEQVSESAPTTNNTVEQTEKNEENTHEQQEVAEKKYSKGEKVTLNNAIEIKILPIIYSTNIAKVEANTEVTIVEIMNAWCKIEKGQVSGWVRKAWLNNEKKQDEVQNQNPETVETNTSPEETKPEQSNTAPEENNINNAKPETKEPVVEQKNKIGYVNVDTVNIRKETNTSCAILGQVSKNTEVEILEELQGWYKIKSSSLTGYIASKYISNQKVADTTSRGSTEERAPVENTTNNNQENPQASANIQTTQEPVVQEPNVEQKQEPVQSTANSKGEQIVAKAKEYLGYKYVSGGASPSAGFDCSGFTVYIYKQFGVSLSRASTAQASNGTAVDKNNLQLGDLVIFNNGANTRVGHVGIYIGGNNFIHASNPSDGVKITSLSNSYYLKRYVGARRVL